MAGRPPFYTFLDRSLSNIDMGYAESPLNTTGFQPGQTIPSKIHNTLWLIDGLWQTYFDYGILRIPDYIDTATSQRWSTDRLLYPGGTSVVAGPGAGPLSYGVYFFDGLRVELSELIMKPSGADPLLQPLATKPGRLWIYLRTADISPSQPFATIRVESVAPATLSAPAAGELALVGVDINAAGVTIGNTYPVVEPSEIVQFGTRGQVWKGPATFDIGLTALIVESVDGYQGVSGGPALAPQGFSTDGAATFNNSVDLGGLATDPITVIGALTVNEFAVFASGVQGPALGPLALNEGATMPANKSIVGDATTRLTTGKVTSLTFVEAVNGFHGPGSTVAITPFGLDADGDVEIGTIATDLLTIHSSLTQDLDFNGASAKDVGKLILEVGNLPLNAGQLTAAAGGVLQYQPAGTSHLVHTTEKGYLFKIGPTEGGFIPAGNSHAGVSEAILTPPSVGKVNVSFSGYLDFEDLATTCRISIRDVIAAVTLNGGGAGLVEFPITIALAPVGHSVSGSINYTLPNNALRAFSLEIFALGGDVTYTDMTLTVTGVDT